MTNLYPDSIDGIQIVDIPSFVTVLADPGVAKVHKGIVINDQLTTVGVPAQYTIG